MERAPRPNARQAHRPVPEKADVSGTSGGPRPGSPFGSLRFVQTEIQAIEPDRRACFSYVSLGPGIWDISDLLRSSWDVLSVCSGLPGETWRSGATEKMLCPDDPPGHWPGAIARQALCECHR